MDESPLVVHAIQFSNEEWFNDRYRRFPTEEERDSYFRLLKDMLSEETMKTVSRVNLLIQVETLSEGEN